MKFPLRPKYEFIAKKQIDRISKNNFSPMDRIVFADSIEKLYSLLGYTYGEGIITTMYQSYRKLYPDYKEIVWCNYPIEEPPFKKGDRFKNHIVTSVHLQRDNKEIMWVVTFDVSERIG